MILVFEQDHQQSENLRLTMNEITPYLHSLSPVAGNELCARFDGGRLSSDGGVLLFPEIERRLGTPDLLASRMTDERAPASTTHSDAAMIRARMFAIACGTRTPEHRDGSSPGPERLPDRHRPPHAADGGSAYKDA